ncbi:hypothetical protein CR969_01335 [Candidatus Saccharibacteria bacterium]|nr:MAG: hypothetical protein CR969_01335 [Candidatus Saccharibacteria bacterium]
MKSLQLTSPHIIAMVGNLGAGKTQFANEFAKMFKAPKLEYSRLEALIGDAKSAAELNQDLLDEFLKTGKTIVFDGPTNKRILRAELVKKARQNGYKVLFVWVQTDEATAKARWMKKHHHDATIYEQELKRFSQPHETENYVVISGRHTYSTQARTVLRRLTEGRASSNPVVPNRRTVGRLTVE